MHVNTYPFDERTIIIPILFSISGLSKISDKKCLQIEYNNSTLTVFETFVQCGWNSDWPWQTITMVKKQWLKFLIVCFLMFFGCSGDLPPPMDDLARLSKKLSLSGPEMLKLPHHIKDPNAPKDRFNLVLIVVVIMGLMSVLPGSYFTTANEVIPLT